jgi:hypothetical protein
VVKVVGDGTVITMATRFVLPSDGDGSLVMGTVITVAMRFVLPTNDDGTSKNPTIRQKK